MLTQPLLNIISNPNKQHKVFNTTDFHPPTISCSKPSSTPLPYLSTPGETIKVAVNEEDFSPEKESQKEIPTKLTKSLLDMIILQFLDQEPTHGYKVITKIRENFGVYFGPGTIYPLLGSLEKKGYIVSTWNMQTERPRKVYALTTDGQTVLNFTEVSLNLICNITAQTKISAITKFNQTIPQGTNTLSWSNGALGDYSDFNANNTAYALMACSKNQVQFQHSPKSNG